MVIRGRAAGRDWGLTLRMYFVMFLLSMVYLAFIAILYALGINWIGIAFFAGIILFVQYFFSHKIVLWSMGAKIVKEEEQPKLHAIVTRLAEQAKLPKPQVAFASTDIPNAFATGRNPKNSVVCVTSGIMRRLTDQELEAVLGHEITHIKNRDVMVITLASFFATVAGMLTQMLFWMGLMGGGRDRNNNGGGIMIAYLAAALVSFIANLLILAIGRYREYAADYGGSVLTGMPSKLASALMKISGTIAMIPTEDLRKVEIANAFFIISAFKGDSIMELFSSHPPVQKRVARLEALAQEIER